MATKFTLKHPQTGLLKEGYMGYSWVTWFFGGIPAICRGDLVTGIIVTILWAITAGWAGFFWAFLYNKKYTMKLLESGYQIFEPSNPLLAQKAQSAFGIMPHFQPSVASSNTQSMPQSTEIEGNTFYRVLANALMTDAVLTNLAKANIFSLSQIDRQTVAKQDSFAWKSVNFENEKLVLFFIDEKPSDGSTSFLITDKYLYYNLAAKTITTSCDYKGKIALSNIASFSISTSKRVNIHISINNQPIGQFMIDGDILNEIKQSLEKIFSLIVAANAA